MSDNSPSRPPEGQLAYRLLTGRDDRAFCERVSTALDEGWVLYGEPRVTYDWWRRQMKVAQAVVWPGYNTPLPRRD